MHAQLSPQPAPPRTARWTLGVVSFLNARPLVEPLTGDGAVRIEPDVPSRLAEPLLSGAASAALLPVVDCLRQPERLVRISDACIGSDGDTLTVRVFSKSPPDRMTRLHVDADSHTSIVLAQVLWRELYARRLEIVAWQEGASPSEEVDSVLVIGDKVVRARPRGYAFAVDLGGAWKHLTGLPFVFAAWYGRRGEEHRELAALLERARDEGVARADEIARSSAARHGWPEEVAREYLCRIMKYRIDGRMVTGLDRFAELGRRHGLLP